MDYTRVSFLTLKKLFVISNWKRERERERERERNKIFDNSIFPF